MDTIMDKYIDIHSHILYGIDDGSKSLEESKKILEQHKEMGFKDIIATPHFIKNSKYITNNKEKQKLLESLKQEAKKLNLNLYIGNEVFITNELEELLENKEISTLNNSKYLLIELPMTNKIKNIKEIIYELKIQNITPIIAHPERYECIQKKPEKVKEWIEEGALLQANYGSIIGIYGKKSKKTLKKLLKQNQISFIATDIHYPDNKIYQNIKKIRKKLIRILGEEKFNNLTINNPKKVLENKELD